MPTRTTIKTIVVLASIIMFAGIITWFIRSESMVQPPASAILSGERSDVFTNIAGEVISLRDYDSSVRVVNSWASWCPFCGEELQDFNRVAAEYASQDVVILAVNRNESRSRAQAFMNTLPELSHIQVVLDVDDYLYHAFGGYAMPETVIYDRNGDIVYHHRGVMTEDLMREHINTALQIPR